MGQTPRIGGSLGEGACLGSREPLNAREVW
jgi:hypothetical protein